MGKKKEVYLIKDVTEYGKLMAFAIHMDLNVFRVYWDEQEKGKMCYFLDFREKRVYYASMSYWINNGYKVITPIFVMDAFGNWVIMREGERKCETCALYGSLCCPYVGYKGNPKGGCDEWRK